MSISLSKLISSSIEINAIKRPPVVALINASVDKIIYSLDEAKDLPEFQSLEEYFKISTEPIQLVKTLKKLEQSIMICCSQNKEFQTEFVKNSPKTMLHIIQINLNEDHQYSQYDNVVLTDEITDRRLDMHLAATLSKIKLDNNDVIKQYLFSELDFSNPLISDDLLEKLKKKVVICSADVATKKLIVNDMTFSGLQVVQKYVINLLLRRCDEILLQWLSSKNNNYSSLTTLHSSLSNEIQTLKAKNFLSADRVLDKRYDVTVNDSTYTLADKSEILSGGKIVILPEKSLTEQERLAGVCPNIYMLLNLSNQIKFIQLTIKMEK